MPAGKKRVYLTVTALALVALLVDRLILPSPTGADAALVPRPPRSAPVAANAQAPSATAPTATVPELPFPRNLPTWSEETALRDIFSPTGSVEPSDNHGGSAEKHFPEGHGTIAALQRDTHLEAVYVTERLKIAVIGGRRMGIGQEVGGCRILSVDGGGVRFLCRDGESVLTLQPGITPTGD